MRFLHVYEPEAAKRKRLAQGYREQAEEALALAELALPAQFEAGELDLDDLLGGKPDGEAST